MDTLIRPLDTVRVVGTPLVSEGGWVVPPVAFTAPLVFARRGVFGTSYTAAFPEAEPLVPSSRRRVHLVDLQSRTVSRVTVRVNKVATERLGAISRDIRLGAPVVHGVTGDALGAASDVPAIAAGVGSVIPSAAASLGLGSIVKYSSLTSTPVGVINLYDASRALSRAHAINDTAGKLFGAIAVLRGGFDIFKGAVLGVIRSITIAYHFSGAVGKVVAVAGQALGIASTAVSAIGLLLLTIPSIINGIRGIGFLRAMNQPLEASFAALRGCLELSDQEIADAAANLQCRNSGELYDLVKDPIMITLEHEQILTPEDKRKIEAVIHALPLPPARLIRDIDSARAHLRARLQRLCAEKKLAKEANYLRYAGAKSLEALKKGAEPAEVVALAKKEAIKKLVVNIAIVLTSVIAIAGLIVTTVFTGGAPLIIGAALLIIINVAFFALDLYFVKENLEALKKATWLDKALLATVLVLTIASVAVGAVFSGGLLPLLLVLIGGGISIAVQTGTLSYSLLSHRSSSSTAVAAHDTRLYPSEPRRPRRTRRSLPRVHRQRVPGARGYQPLF